MHPVDKFLLCIVVTLSAFGLPALTISYVFGPRSPEDCVKACSPSTVVECGRTILCAPSPAARSVNPCPTGDCKDGSR